MAALAQAALLGVSMLAAPEGEASGSASVSTSAREDGSSDRPMLKWAPERHMFELGVFAGLLIPNADHEFYDPRVIAQREYRRVAADLGVRFGYYPLRWLGGEFEVGFMPTRTEDDARSLLYAIRGHAVLQLPWWRLTPLLVVGGGGMGVSSGNGAQGDDIDASFHWGPGLKFYANRWIALRLDFRHLVGARLGFENGAASHFEVLLGLSVTLGRKKREERRDDSQGDPDGDGFYGSDDRCPDEPGTYPDGCPAPDRDDDGVADADDECPDEPGPAPKGCPADPDRDGDGVSDSVDQCPDTPGSKPHGCPPDTDGDGITDDQDQCPELAGPAPTGCPPDTDGDGIHDPVDDCKDDPETRNGFEDDDGCPDKVPKRLRGATGVLPGINFELNSAKITPDSKPTLDDAAATLRSNPKYDVEIVGHTDSTGDHDYNVRLSKKRAESVKKYLIKQGVEPARIKTEGKGPDDPVGDNETDAGRAENRRIEFKVRKRRRNR